jgi:hypothetical protein
VIGEGLVALNGKLEYKIVRLELMLQKKQQQSRSKSDELASDLAGTTKINDLKIFGYFSILKGIFESIMTMVGGAISDKMSINGAYFIMSFYPIIVICFVHFFFKEEKVSDTTSFVSPC